MVEYLALPAWETPPVKVADWVAGLSVAGGPVVVSRESSDVSWLEVAALRLRGYAVIEDGQVAAINFELRDPDPGPATRLLEEATVALGWELHADDDQAPDDDE